MCSQKHESNMIMFKKDYWENDLVNSNRRYGNMAKRFKLFFCRIMFQNGCDITKRMYLFPLLHIYIEKKSIPKKIYNCD